MPEDYPRSRGEHPDAAVINPPAEGSPPLTRGTPFSSEEEFIRFRITPAHAGNTGRIHKEGRVYWDHPRSRGEHFVLSFFSI